MKTRTSKIVIAIQAVLYLTACQSLQKEESPALKMAPTANVRHGASRPETLYAMGRYYQGQINYDKAIDAYRTLLEIDPKHVEARNSLGMILAAQGKYDQAIAELVQAAMDAPDSARIRNNLGYAHLLRGDFAKAAAVLQTAAQLDPLNPRVRENLRTAMANSGTKVSPGPTGPSGPGGSATDVAKADPLPVEVKPVTAQFEINAVAAPAGVATDGMYLKAVAPNVYSLVPAVNAPLLVANAASVKPAAVPAAAAAPGVRADGGDAGKRVRLEVSNGNGITGMARKTSRQLQEVGYASARLTNEKPFRLATTEIQYRPGFEVQARELQIILRPGVPMVASSQLRSDVQVRLALGKDAKSSSELVAQTPSPRTVVRSDESPQSTPGG